jgi:hypothetical protein
MTPNYHNPNAPSIFNHSHRPAKKTNTSRRKFFSSSLVWDADRREVVQIENGLKWRPGMLNINQGRNKFNIDEDKDPVLTINGDEEAAINDVDDAEMEEPDIDGMDEDVADESGLTNGDGLRTRQSTSRAQSILR